MKRSFPLAIPLAFPLLVALSFTLAGCFPVTPGGGDGGDRDLSSGKDGGGDSGMVIQPKWSALYADYFQSCKNCHTPTAPGRTMETEKTLDFSSLNTGFTTMTTGKAAGLVGNQKDCNGVTFIESGNPAKSLALAVLDQSVRNGYDNTMFPNCDKDTITDMTLKAGDMPSQAFLTAFRQWIADKAPNN